MWSTDTALKLIEDLQRNPCLWDVTAIDYRNRDKWASVLTELAEKYKSSVAEVEKKLHTLKSQFWCEHKKLDAARKSGASPKKCSWFGYEPIMFLLPAQESRGSSSTDAEAEAEDNTVSTNTCLYIF